VVPSPRNLHHCARWLRDDVGSVAVLSDPGSRGFVQGIAGGGNIVLTMNHSAHLDDVLREIACIRAVAVEVLRDVHAAEDVVQETLLAATKRPEGTGTGTSTLRAWLRSTARYLALAASRRRHRRQRREEAVARPELVASDADVLERVALQRRVAAAVEALPSPDREIVALRYWDGAQPREIARRLGLTPNAVSTRLTRARARLAHALEDDDPRRSSSGATRWAIVAAAWRPHTGPPVAVSLLPLGALAMKQLAVVALLIAAAFLVRGALQRNTPLHDSGSAPLVAEGPAELLALDHDDGSPIGAERRTTATRATLSLDEPATSVLPATAAPTTGRIEVRVAEAGSGAPARGIGLELYAWSSRRTWHDVQQAVTDAKGGAVFERVPPGECTVYIHRLTEGDTMGAESLELAAGETRSVRFQVVPGVTIRGVVRDYAGRAVAGAEVWLGTGASEPYDGEIVTATDVHGRYELRHASSFQGVAARAPGLAPSRAVAPIFVDERQGEGAPEAYEVDLVLPAVGGTLQGSVVDAAGAPVAGALVVVGDSQMGRRELVDGKPTHDPPRLVLRADDAGRFATDVMGAGSVLVRARGAESAPAEARVEVPVGGVATVRLVVGPAARVFGRVVTDKGAAVEGARIELSTEDRTLARARTTTDASGVFDLPGLPPGAVTLELESDLLRSSLRASFELTPLETREWLPTLVTPVELVGRVVDEAGVGLADWIVRRAAEGEQGDDTMGTGNTRTDATGEFRLTGCLDAPHTLTVRPPGKIFAKPVAEARGVTPAAGVTTIVVAAREVPKGSLTGRCIGPDDASLAAQVTLEVDEPRGLDDYVSRSVTTDSEGRFALRHVPFGVYQLRLTCDGHELVAPLELVTLDDASPTMDLGMLRFAKR
jgi:RNA polymerase sigma factor (sigma-70 family)